MKKEAGKGSKPRPFQVPRSTFESNWEHTFKKPTRLANPLNQEEWLCNDLNAVQFVDGVEYIRVYKKDTPSRTNLMRKTALQKV